MTPERWEFTSRYTSEVFGAQDAHLAGLMDRAVAAGLPPISVSSDVGRLLGILAGSTDGKLALELGTLGGYSAIWIARGMRPDGRLITIEANAHHAEFARKEIEEAGVADRVEVEEGEALVVLPGLGERLGEASVDFVFIDAVKSEYVDYFEEVRPLMKPGGLVVADNVLGTGAGWIDSGHGTDAFNRLVASDPEFDAAAVPLREGIMIARRR